MDYSRLVVSLCVASADASNRQANAELTECRVPSPSRWWLSRMVGICVAETVDYSNLACTVLPVGRVIWTAPLSVAGSGTDAVPVSLLALSALSSMR